MPLWLAKRWDALRTTYWFLPLLMGTAAIGLALGMVELDRRAQAEPGPRTWWAYTGGPEGARGVMATVAGSMITVAGVVFSITVVALSLAANQFGPRLLRNFIRDRPSQVVLGTFTATFLYCLLVLRAVRGTEDRHFVPQGAVALGILLGVAGLGVLIYFIHHVATSIRVEAVVQRVTHELLAAVDNLWPGDVGDDEPEPPALPHGEPAPVGAAGSGYLDAVDGDALLALGGRHDVVVRLAGRPGDFVVAGARLADVWPADRLTDEVRAGVNEAVALAHQRSPFQDAVFVMDQLAEVAVRALSPSLNDPFTAEACIDRMGQALCRAAGRGVESPFRSDADGRLRVVTRPTDFGDLVEAGFGRLREYAAPSAAVVGRAISTLGLVAAQARRASDRAHALRHLELLYRAASDRLVDEPGRADLDQRYHQAIALGGRPKAVPASAGRPVPGQVAGR